jgi:tetratricopeptide (TPR) repeat protein
MDTRIATIGVVAAISVLGVSRAAAQMAVTTFGATDAASCYENASDDFSRETDPCDQALASGGLTRADRLKTLVNRGIIHNRNGDLQAAVDDFNAALEIDASVGEAYLNRGNSYYLSGQYDSALADYDSALANNVNKPWAAWYNIGLAYEAKKDKQKAREAYEKALELNPSFSPARVKLASLGRE